MTEYDLSLLNLLVDWSVTFKSDLDTGIPKNPFIWHVYFIAFVFDFVSNNFTDGSVLKSIVTS